MKRTETALLAIALALSIFPSGCVVEERGRVVESSRGGPPPWAPAYGYRRQETYYYYPDVEVYFYPNVRTYYWLERGVWKNGSQPPRNFVIEERTRVTLDLDYEPHTQHATIRGKYPPGHYAKERREERREEKGRY
jgi:hypothetical protein